MPFDVDALSRTERITNKSVPIALANMDDDEWIEIRSIRDALEDFNAQVRAMRLKAESDKKAGPEEGSEVDFDEDPDVAEAENMAQDNGASISFATNEGLRYMYVWRYMCVDFNCYALASPEDRAKGKRRGRKLDPKSVDDKDKLFRLVGDTLINILAAKDGSIPTPEVKGPNGKMADFQDTGNVGDSGQAPGTTDTGSGLLEQDRTADTRDKVGVSAA